MIAADTVTVPQEDPFFDSSGGGCRRLPTSANAVGDAMACSGGIAKRGAGPWSWTETGKDRPSVVDPHSRFIARSSAAVRP